MVNFNALKVGETLWYKVRTKQGGTKLRDIAVTPVTILAIDQNQCRVQAQWGTTGARWYGSETVHRWCRRRPRGLPEAVFRKTLK